VVHKQKVGFSSEMYGLSGLDKEKGNLLIHVGSISKKYEWTWRRISSSPQIWSCSLLSNYTA